MVDLDKTSFMYNSKVVSHVTWASLRFNFLNWQLSENMHKLLFVFSKQQQQQPHSKILKFSKLNLKWLTGFCCQLQYGPKRNIEHVSLVIVGSLILPWRPKNPKRNRNQWNSQDQLWNPKPSLLRTQSHRAAIKVSFQ